MSPVDVCLITPGHLSSTPRLCKEACSLRAKGYKIRVVASDHFAPNRPLDEVLLGQVRWTAQRVPGSRTVAARLLQRLKREAARWLFRTGIARKTLGPRAMFSRHKEFVAAALERPARLYLGHGLPGLCIAAEAARRSGGLLGFDAEDWHSEEQEECQLASGEKLLRQYLERSLLPHCRHLSAASPLIAEAYAPLAGRSPLTVLNVFPLSEAPAGLIPHETRARTLYWFSQTIGPGRGLEQILQALPLLPPDWCLHLRGLIDPGFREQLNGQAQTLGLVNRIQWLDTAPAHEMVRLCATHRIGLSLELSSPANRDRCLTNKLFTYLLAGTPTLLSDTAAHRAIAPSLGEAVRIAPLGDPAALAAAITALDNTLAASEAWRLAQTQYNWDKEQLAFLRHITQTLLSPDAHPPHR